MIEFTEKKVVIPTIENTIDDIYLMIAVYVLKKVEPSKELHNLTRTSIYDILTNDERHQLYETANNELKKNTIKVVFNILDDSHLLKQLEAIKSYPNDFEVTLPSMKSEYDAWTKQITTKGI
uniref:hypothetical protein n=1 Tax=Persicitalea sp. TaxID=3100273 RepID=UPI00359442DF